VLEHCTSLKLYGRDFFSLPQFIGFDLNVWSVLDLVHLVSSSTFFPFISPSALASALASTQLDSTAHRLSLAF
jgi:hypothetical protein